MQTLRLRSACQKWTLIQSPSQAGLRERLQRRTKQAFHRLELQ